MTEYIRVYYKPLGTVQGKTYYHKYIVYTDSNGNDFGARGGPSEDSNKQLIDFSQATFYGGNDFGYIETVYGTYDETFPDYNDPADEIPGDFFETIAEDDDLSAEWEAIKDAMDDIEADGHRYQPLFKNSNSAADEALARAGLPEPTLEDTFYSPASDVDLSPPGDWLEGLPDLPGKILDALNPFNAAHAQSSPLVLDLDGDGIELTDHNAATTTTFFDLDGNEFATQTAWVGDDDGLLVIDLDSNGFIDNGTELFGTPTVDGFAVLAEMDSNGDLVIDASDAAWTDLLIWNDANQDAFSQTSELASLSSYNIVSIDLAGVSPSTQTISGNAISHTSTFKYANGTTDDIVDAWLEHDTVNSYYSPSHKGLVPIVVLPRRGRLAEEEQDAESV